MKDFRRVDEGLAQPEREERYDYIGRKGTTAGEAMDSRGVRSMYRCTSITEWMFEKERFMQG